MKRFLSFALVLAMLASLLAGCGGSGAEETTPTTESTEATELVAAEVVEQETEPEETYLTKEEFEARLNEKLTQQELPPLSDSEFYDTYFSFTNISADGKKFPLRGFSITIEDASDAAALEMLKKVAIAASTVCDDTVTEELLNQMFATEPADSSDITYNAPFYSYRRPEVYGIFISSSRDVQHYLQVRDNGEVSYDVNFFNIPDDAGPEIDVDSYPTVDELEAFLNQMLQEMNFPYELRFYPYYTYGVMYSNLRYTGEGTPEEESPMERALRYYFGPMIKANGRDYPVKSISYNFGYYIDPEVDAVLMDMIEETIPMLESAFPGLIRADEIRALFSMEPMEEDEWGDLYKYQETDKVYYELCENPEYNSYDLHIEFTELQGRAFEPHIPQGAEILAPEYLRYPFPYSEPVVVDGWFNMEQNYYLYGVTSEEMTFLYWLGLLQDYLDYTCSDVGVQYHDYTYSGEVAAFFFEEKLDLDHYGMLINDQNINMYYNTNVEEYASDTYFEPEYLLRVPIGLSLITDEGMTPEEAVRLHTHAMEPTTTAGDWQITYYCPREVMHIVQVNPTTGENTYDVMPIAYFETSEGMTVEEFMAQFEVSE